MSSGGSENTESTGSARLSSSVLGVAIVAITGMQLMSTLDGTIVIVALPRMQAELDLSDAGKSWIITAYVLAFGGLLLLGGRIGDAIGHKRAFLSGVGTFTIASLVCGVATDEATLIIARAVQGIGAAVAAPTGLALIATTYAVGHARNRAMAVSAAMQAIGSVLGLVLGGALTVVSWRLAFLINVPIGIVIVAIAVLRLAETDHERLKLDITGALLATLGCTSAVLLFTQGPARGWSDPYVIGAGVASALFFLGFLVVERSADHPIVPLSVFGNRNRVATFIVPVLRRRRDAVGDGGHRAVCPGRDGLLRTQGGRVLHPVRAGARRGHGRRGAARPARFAPGDDLRRGITGPCRDALRLDPQPRRPVLSRPDRAARRRRLRHRRDLGDPAAVRGRRRGPPRDRSGLVDHVDGAKPRRSDGAGRHPGRPDVTHAVPRRNHGPGDRHDIGSARRTGCGLHVLPALGGRSLVFVGAAALFIGFSASQIATAQHNREAVEAGEL